MTDDFRTKNRSHIARALGNLTEATDSALQGHRDQLESIRRAKSGFGPRPVDWPAEAKVLARRVVVDAKKLAGIWWQMVKALASDEVLYAAPGGRHERTIKLRSVPRQAVHLKPTELRKLGEGSESVRRPHRVVCEPEILEAGGDGRFKVFVEVGGMDPGIYIGRVQTDAADEAEIEYSIYVSEYDAEVAPPA